MKILVGFYAVFNPHDSLDWRLRLSHDTIALTAEAAIAKFKDRRGDINWNEALKIGYTVRQITEMDISEPIRA